MNLYQKNQRLQSDSLIGQAHIAVRQNQTHNYPQHWHNYFEIELILSGSAKHTYNGMEYTVEKGDLYLLTPVDFHGIEVNEPLELINISFDDSYLPPSLLSWLSTTETGKLCKLTPDEFERFYMAAKLLSYECASEGPCTKHLLEYLLSCFTRRTPEQAGQTAKAEHLQRITKAVSYIELHFREQITLEQLAGLSGYNPSYFSELFYKVTGQTYKKRLQERRISYAKMLLSNGFSVSETCFAAGFGSLSNFTAAFRKNCGISPSDYRKSMCAAGNRPNSPPRQK